MYTADLSPLGYHNGAFDSENWNCPLLAVGWLEHPHPFDKGAVLPDFFLRLSDLLEQTDLRFMDQHFRGLHECSICVSQGHEEAYLSKSYRNIFIPGSNTVYVAPGGILHYMEAHGYAPPREFIAAVMRCPDLTDTGEYLEALKRANKNTSPPLEDDATSIRKARETTAAILRNRQEK